VRSDAGQPHDVQPDTGLEGIYYHAPRHSLMLVLPLEGGRQFSRERSLSRHGAYSAAAQLVRIRDKSLSWLERAIPTNDWSQFRRFIGELA
jgi:hypothetical protein